MRDEKLDLDAIEARAKAATVPPTHDEVAATEHWNADGLDVYTPSGMGYMRGYGGDSIMVAECVSAAVATFIAAAREDVPALVAYARELEADLGDAQATWRDERKHHQRAAVDRDDARAERDAAIARADQAERERDKFDRILLDSLNQQGKLEAQCAAMREALEAGKCRLCADTGTWSGSCRRCDDSTDDHECVEKKYDCDLKSCVMKRAALAPDAGRALLAELAALREMAEAVQRYRSVPLDMGNDAQAAYHEMLAKLDALKAVLR